MGLLRTMVASTTATRVDELSRLDTAVRAPSALSTRVGFTGVSAAIGCSVVAGLTASVLAARRPHHVLAVNASRAQRSLLWHAGLTSCAVITGDHATTRRTARDSAQATSGLARTPGGLHCLDLHSEEQPSGDAAWWDSVAPSGRFFDFIVTDWGVRTPATVGSVVAASTVVCVVTSADRTSLQHGVDLAHAVEGSGVTALLAVVDAAARRTTAIGECVRLLPLPAIEFGHDRAHGAARPTPSRFLKPATNLAALRLAAAAVDAVATRHMRAPGRTA